jgi:stalled ribosome rescue protein Dom34
MKIGNRIKGELLMNRKVGLWLDRNKAVIVSITNDGEERRIITSNMEHYVRYSSNVPGDGSAEDVRDRRFWNHLGEYYEKVIACIGDAKSIMIFGPGEAKSELKRHLESEGMLENIVSVDDADNGLTDRQIAKRVRERFPARAYFDIF